MSCNQFGFTKQKSTLDAIQFVIEKEKQQIKEKLFLLFISWT
jgi:hypothetical protein